MTDSKDNSFLKANILFFIFLVMGTAAKAFLDKWEVPHTTVLVVFIPFFAALLTCLSYQNYLKIQLDQNQRRQCLYNFYFLSLFFKLLFLGVVLIMPVLTDNAPLSYLLAISENKLSENPVAVSFIIICFLISDFILIFLGIIGGYLLAPKLSRKIAHVKEVEFWHPTTHFVYLFALLFIGLKAILFILPEEMITPYLGYVFVLLAAIIVISAYQNANDGLSKENRDFFKRHLWLASIFIDLPVLIYLGLLAKNFDKSQGVSEKQQIFIDMYSGDFIYLAISLLIVGNYFLIGLSFIIVEIGKKKIFHKGSPAK